MNSKMPTDIDFFVIEDTQTQFEHLCLSLKKLGYNGDIVHAKSISSGLKLIELLEQSKTNIDIVICDMHLPDGKGIEILEKIRGTSFLSSKPFLVYTSDDDSNLIIDCFEKGATSYLAKPYTDNELEEKIQYCWNSREKEEKRAGLFYSIFKKN